MHLMVLSLTIKVFEFEFKFPLCCFIALHYTKSFIASLPAEVARAQRREEEDEEGENTPRANGSGGGAKRLPDFGQSPIDSRSHVHSSFSEQLRAESPGGSPYVVVEVNL